MDILKTDKAQPHGNCSKCMHYQKQIARLKKAFIKADDDSVRRCMQYEDKILELNAEIKRLKAGHSSGSQSEKKVLEEVGQPESNTTSRAIFSQG